MLFINENACLELVLVDEHTGGSIYINHLKVQLIGHPYQDQLYCLCAFVMCHNIYSHTNQVTKQINIESYF